MDWLRKNKGFTILELLIASLLASVVFLAVTSVYVSGLRLLTSTEDAKQLDAAIAMHAMSKNITLANQVTVSTAGPVTGQQLTLRLDYNNDANGMPTLPKYTADPADDLFIMYAFIGNALRTTWGNAAANVVATDREVTPGLVVTAGSFTLFNPVNNISNAVTISILSGGRTLNTTVVAGAASKNFA